MTSPCGLALLLALLLALSAVASAATPSALSQQPAAQRIANASDAAGVNYALTIERLDSTYWSCYLSTYTVANQPYCAYISNSYQQFSEADFAAEGYNATVWQAVNLIAAEEITHAALLNITVQALGYAPVEPCEYVYPVASTVVEYLTQGLKFETVGTAAYAGSLNGLSNPALVQAAASIASVEARHAGYLSALLNVQPFASSAFNDAYNSSYVAELITPYYVDPACLARTTLPTVRPFGATDSAVNGQKPAPFTGAESAAYNVKYTNAQLANDLKTLNYALVLEQLEQTFYNKASTAFSAADFEAAGLTNNVVGYLGIIAANENTHVAVLTALINAYGGTPVTYCSYNFSALGYDAFSSVANYLAFASTVEGVGVRAYDGAANTLTDTYLLQAAGTIDLIEARHVAFINALLYKTDQTQAFPTATDSPLAPADVYALVTGAGIITSCGTQAIHLPVSVYPVPGASSVLGDPVFDGFRGQHFNVAGKPGRVYSLLSAPQLSLSSRFVRLSANSSLTAQQQGAVRAASMQQAKRTALLARLRGGAMTSTAADTATVPPATTAWSHRGTYLGESGLVLGASRLHVQPGSYASGFASVTLDGADVPVSAQPILLSGGAVSVTRPSAFELSVASPDVAFTLVNSDRFVNIQRAMLLREDNSEQLSGLLGQTAHEGWQAPRDAEGKQQMERAFEVQGDELFGSE